jgi:beta-aspartyl-peptidase (threonine type)
MFSAGRLGPAFLLPSFAFSTALRENALDSGHTKMKNFSLSAIIILVITMTILGQTDKEPLAIRKVMDDQAVAWNKGDIDGFMKGYWQSEKLTFVSGAEVTRGWQQTLDRYKKSYNSRAKMGTLTFSDLEFIVVQKDTAVVLGSWALAGPPEKPHGKFTLTFRKFKEGWRIVMDHTS